MNNEGVLIKSFVINKNKQIKVFDIKIPRQAQYIIGMEMGLVFESGTIPHHPVFNEEEALLTFKPSIVLGELKLQSFDSANLFYVEELKVCQNFNQADFSGLGFNPTPYSHQTKSLEDPINVSGGITIAQGVYRNSLELPIPYRYKVNVYVWLKNK